MIWFLSILSVVLTLVIILVSVKYWKLYNKISNIPEYNRDPSIKKEVIEEVKVKNEELEKKVNIEEEKKVIEENKQSLENLLQIKEDLDKSKEEEKNEKANVHDPSLTVFIDTFKRDKSP